MKTPFDEEYYMNGIASGRSNYFSYSWLHDETLAYATYLTRHLGLKGHHSIHDLGCARGFLVKALRMLGNEATGSDISEWAIENCDESVKGFVSNELSMDPKSVDWVHCKDVLEHIPEEDIHVMLPKLINMTRVGAFFIVPLTYLPRGPYIYPADNMDKTHLIHNTLGCWMRWFLRAADTLDAKGHGHFSVSGSYHLHGLKQASIDHPFSTGFFTIKRFS